MGLQPKCPPPGNVRFAIRLLTQNGKRFPVGFEMVQSDSKATECVVLIKPDGTIHGPYKAAFSKNIIRVFGQSIEVADGDSLERPLCNGQREIYIVEKATFVRGIRVSLDNWKMIVRKETSDQDPSSAQFPNNGIRIAPRIQPVDFNIQQVAAAIQSLITAIDESTADEQDKADAKSRLQDLLRQPVVTVILGPAAAALAEAANE